MENREVSVSGAQVRQARELLGWSQDRLANSANISSATISYFETGKRRVTLKSVTAIRGALEAAGVEFTAGQAGARLSVPRDATNCASEKPTAKKL